MKQFHLWSVMYAWTLKLLLSETRKECFQSLFYFTLTYICKSNLCKFWYHIPAFYILNYFYHIIFWYLFSGHFSFCNQCSGLSNPHNPDFCTSPCRVYQKSSLHPYHCILWFSWRYWVQEHLIRKLMEYCLTHAELYISVSKRLVIIWFNFIIFSSHFLRY